MDRKSLLVERLREYGESDMYPFHMPGHKRRGEFPNPFTIDITEIEGFDNLHHPEGILKESMEWAASVYGADRTYYLVNGSSCGVLSAICGTTSCGGTILMSRNCHKSAYHGAVLNRLHTIYGYPETIGSLGIQGGLTPDEVERCLALHPETEAVLVVSPTYDGMVSDIEEIARVVHRWGIVLIVDEAHGAHLPFGKDFPKPALECGADLVVQSLHKTLGSFTQTAVLHVKGDRVDAARLERYLQMFQSSSPSYVLMAGMEQCIYEMAEHGTAWMGRFADEIGRLRKELTGESGLKHLKLAGRELCGADGVFDLDESKLVVSARGCTWGHDGMTVDGAALSEILRRTYHLEMEMCGADYVVAITSYLDTAEGLDRLKKALLEIDAGLESSVEEEETDRTRVAEVKAMDGEMTMAEAQEVPFETVMLEESAGRISAEFVYLYPPGIPIVTPGERVTDKAAGEIVRYREIGLLVQGMADRSARRLRVIK